VWLASCSLRVVEDSRIVPTSTYGDAERRVAYHLLRRALEGVGDRAWERVFRMCVTTCMHRGLTDAEIARLPDGWHAAQAVDIAGGPVEVIRSRSPIGPIPSAEPCERPRLRPMSEALREYAGVESDPSRDVAADGSTLYFPEDCGACRPCAAREAIAPRYGGRPPAEAE
jgi:hypothetical protein